MNSANLHERLTCLFAVERKTTAQIVSCLREVSQTRFYLRLGYSSLFSYLTEHFKHPPATAQRWIDNVRMTQAEPLIQKGLEAGELNLTQISVLAQAVREKKKTQPSNPVLPLAELVEKIKNQNTQRTQVLVAEALNVQIKRHETKRFQRDESVRCEITLSAAQFQELQRVKEIVSHRHLNPSLSDLFSILAADFLKRKDPLRKKSEPRDIAESQNEVGLQKKVELQNKVESQNEVGLQKKEELQSSSLQRGSTSATEVKTEANRDFEMAQVHVKTVGKAGLRAKREAKVSAASRRVVFQRDQKCCVCGSKFQLQVDHIRPRWAGGGNEVANLQILCAVHNREKYRQEAGVAASI